LEQKGKCTHSDVIMMAFAGFKINSGFMTITKNCGMLL